MRIVRFLSLLLLTSVAAPAQDILFIGNSYTMGSAPNEITPHGGVPKFVEAIAASKGKKLNTTMVTVPGKDFAFHLQQPATDTALNARKWNMVVLQDYSTRPTHAGNPAGFLHDAETFYRRVRKASPNAQVLLYETWARPAESPFFTGKTSGTTFKNPGEMDAELQANYKEAARKLEAIEPGAQVRLAEAGAAFMRFHAKFPRVALFEADLHHPSSAGYYLSALVLYATLTGDSPAGATTTPTGIKIDPQVAREMQAVAAEVALKPGSAH